MKHIAIFVLSIFMFSLGVFAHGDGDGHDEEKAISQYEYLLPFIYLDNNEYFSAVIVVVFWIVLLRGIYLLMMMVLGRATLSKK